VYGKLSIVEMHGLVRLSSHKPLAPLPPVAPGSDVDDADEEDDDDDGGRGVFDENDFGDNF